MPSLPNSRLIALHAADVYARCFEASAQQCPADATARQYAARARSHYHQLLSQCIIAHNTTPRP